MPHSDYLDDGGYADSVKNGGYSYTQNFETRRQKAYQDLERRMREAVLSANGNQRAILGHQRAYLSARDDVNAQLDNEYDPHGQEKWLFAQKKAAYAPENNGTPQGVIDNFAPLNAQNEAQNRTNFVALNAQNAAQNRDYYNAYDDNVQADIARGRERDSAYARQERQAKDYLASGVVDADSQRLDGYADQRRQERLGQEGPYGDAATKRYYTPGGWSSLKPTGYDEARYPRPAVAPQSPVTGLPEYDSGDSYGQNKTRVDWSDPSGRSRLTMEYGGIGSSRVPVVRRSMGTYHPAYPTRAY